MYHCPAEGPRRGSGVTEGKSRERSRRACSWNNICTGYLSFDYGSTLRSGRQFLYEQADCGAEWHSALPHRRWPILFVNAILRLRSSLCSSLHSGRRFLYEQADCGAEWHSALPHRRWPILFVNAILRLRSSPCSSLRSGRRAIGFLKQEPGGGAFFFVEAIRAREQGKALS